MTTTTTDVSVGNLDRFILHPLKYPSLYEFYQKHVASFWQPGEIDLQTDVSQFENLSEDKKYFILRVLSFFAASDGIVNENLAKNFSCEVLIPEARQFYDFQIGMEAIHAETYSLLLQSYEKDEKQRNKLFNAVKDVRSIHEKAKWAIRWINNGTFLERLVAFACVEGIFFSASFCAIFYFKKSGLLPGLTFSNELISRDEGLHRDFACILYRTLSTERDLETIDITPPTDMMMKLITLQSKLLTMEASDNEYTTVLKNVNIMKSKIEYYKNETLEPLSQETVAQIITSAVECEKAYVLDALKADLIGMNSQSMMQYVRYVGDHLMQTLGYEPIFNEKNPFDWMEYISLETKTNFFEKRVAEYQKSGAMDSNRDFAIDDDF